VPTTAAKCDGSGNFGSCIHHISAQGRRMKDKCILWLVSVGPRGPATAVAVVRVW